MGTMIRSPSSLFSFRLSSRSFLKSTDFHPPSHLLCQFSNHSLISLKTIPRVDVLLSKRAMKCLSTLSASLHENGSRDLTFQGSELFFRSVLSRMEEVYLNKNPTAKAILELIQSAYGDRICYDHFAFRTFGVNGHGIDSIAKFFLDFGYVKREELRFPAKKLKAFWFSPPKLLHSEDGTRVSGPLPRIFISELLVDQLSPEAQFSRRKIRWLTE